MRADEFSCEFVEFVPKELVEGILYVSMTYSTAVHLCACGCLTKVVTPLSPAKWSLIFDGVSISLTPSIGNWQFPCRSHYWIRQNKVRWAPSWSDEEIAEGRRRDARDLERYLTGVRGGEPESKSTLEMPIRRRPVMQRLAGLFKRG